MPSTTHTRPSSSSSTKQNNYRNIVSPTVKQPTLPVSQPISKKLKIPNVEDKLVSFILDEIIDSGPSVKFNDIGLIKIKRL